MASIKNIVRAMATPPMNTGRVIASSETELSVATAFGVMVVPKDKMSLYAVGDEVKIANGAITGKIRDTSSLPVYEV